MNSKFRYFFVAKRHVDRQSCLLGMLCFAILLYVIDESIGFDVAFALCIEQVKDLVELEILPG